MRCKNCDYALWQISARLCPECGTPFKPSDYEFTLNSVRFCCPHCEQDYYGTGPTGHLVPRSFACVRCARTIDMDEMVLLPTEGVSENQTEVLRQPWLERGKRRSLLSAFFATIGYSLVKPGQLLRATPPESGAGAATLFMLATLGGLCFCYGVMMIIFFAITFGLASSVTPGGGPQFGVGLQSIGTGAGFAAGLLIFWLLILVFSAVVAHGVLKISGGCAYGMGRTWQAFCYSSGANVASAVPCLGAYFGWIWWIVSACIALKEAQKVHGGRATLAVLTVPIVSTVLFIGGYAVLIYFVFAGASGSSMFPTATATLPSNGITRTTALVAAFRSAQTPVRHAAEVIRPTTPTVYDLMEFSDDSNGGYWTRLYAAPVGNTTLGTFMTMNPRQQQLEAAAAAAALPPNTIAYRLGDTVFTHPGIDPHSIPPNSRAEDLWLLIGWPENLVVGTTESISVGHADGTVVTFTASMMPAELAKQNDLRADYGLPPLPDPATVSHTAPAVADEAPMLDLRKDTPKPGTEEPSP